MLWFECPQFARRLFGLSTINFYQLLPWGFIGFTSVAHQLLTAFRINPQFFTMTLKPVLEFGPFLSLQLCLSPTYLLSVGFFGGEEGFGFFFGGGGQAPGHVGT